MYKTNIQFNSNLFLIISEDYKPYNDIDFISNVFDPQKLREIAKYSKYSNILSPLQEKIIDNTDICYHARKNYKIKNYQCYVFTSRYSIKEKCKCKLLKCPKLLTECRKGEDINVIKEEIEQFKKLEQITSRHAEKFYPIISNFERVLERHQSHAYALLSNTDLEKYKQSCKNKISFAYSGGCPNWDNWVGGDLNNYFSSDIGKQAIPQIDVVSSIVAEENPLFKHQRNNNKNKNNPFFQK